MSATSDINYSSISDDKDYINKALICVKSMSIDPRKYLGGQYTSKIPTEYDNIKMFELYNRDIIEAADKCGIKYNYLINALMGDSEHQLNIISLLDYVPSKYDDYVEKGGMTRYQRLINISIDNGYYNFLPIIINNIKENCWPDKGDKLKEKLGNTSAKVLNEYNYSCMNNINDAMIVGSMSGSAQMFNKYRDLCTRHMDDAVISAYMTESLRVLGEYKDSCMHHINDAMVLASMAGNEAIVKEMLDMGGYSYLKSALKAALNNNYNIVKLLFDHKPLWTGQEYAKLTNKKTDLSNINSILSAGGGSMDIVKYMLDLGANIYDDAIIRAAYNGQIDIVKFLMNKTKDKNIKRGEGSEDKPYYFDRETDHNPYDLAIKYAAMNGYLEIIKLIDSLVDYGFEWALSAAAENGYLDIVKYLIEGKEAQNSIEIKVSFPEDFLFYPAEIAAINGFEDIVKYLLTVSKGGYDRKIILEKAIYGAIKGERDKLLSSIIDNFAYKYSGYRNKRELAQYLAETVGNLSYVTEYSYTIPQIEMILKYVSASDLCKYLPPLIINSARNCRYDELVYLLDQYYNELVNFINKYETVTDKKFRYRCNGYFPKKVINKAITKAKDNKNESCKFKTFDNYRKCLDVDRVVSLLESTYEKMVVDGIIFEIKK